MHPTIYTVTGPSGTGKSTLINNVEAQSSARQAYSITTRALRGSDDKRTSVSTDTFLKTVRDGQLLESIIYDENAYGILRKAVSDILAEGCPVLLDCNEAGGRQIIASELAPVTTIFLVIDATTLYNRQMNRGSGSLDSQILRMKKALEEIDGINSGLYDYIIVNDDLQKATEKLLHIVQGTPIPNDP